jgi:hypothetical protein
MADYESLYHHDDSVYDKIEKVSRGGGNIEIPDHTLKPLILYWLKLKHSTNLLLDKRHKNDLYQEIASFLVEQDERHDKDFNYLNLEKEEMDSIKKEFLRKLYQFKKKQGILKDGLYENVYPEGEDGEIDLIANLPKTGTRENMIERALFHIGFFCETALKDHPLGPKNCQDILSLVIIGYTAEEINKSVFDNEKSTEEVVCIIRDLLSQIRKEYAGDKDVLEEVFQRSTRGGGEFTFSERKGEVIERTRQVIDLNGLNRAERIAKIKELLGLNNDPKKAKRQRSQIYRLLNRAEKNNDILIYYPGFQNKRENNRLKDLEE